MVAKMLTVGAVRAGSVIAIVNRRRYLQIVNDFTRTMDELAFLARRTACPPCLISPPRRDRRGPTIHEFDRVNRVLPAFVMLGYREHPCATLHC
jgi:hypothetical protein